MATASEIANTLIEEGGKARAHFQVWWVLRSVALPSYYEVMNNYAHSDFFRAANSGHFTLFILSAAKLFDPDQTAVSISTLRRALRAEGRVETAMRVARSLSSHRQTIERLRRIRNQAIAHNDFGAGVNEVFKQNGVTPDEVRLLIDIACDAIRDAAHDLGITSTIFEGDRFERATLNMLEALEKGARSAP